MGVTNGVCDLCGSGVLENGDHIRRDLEPCDKILDPMNAEFWWEQHTYLVRKGTLDEPVRRNPNDIHEALTMTPAARQAILDGHRAATPLYNIRQSQSAAERYAYTLIARLLDAGVLQRGPNS